MEQKNIKVQEEQEFTLSDIFRIILANWYWFVISIVVCVIFGIVYIKRQPVVYSRTASVLIVNERGGAPSESASFDELKTVNMKNNVENEVSVFKSKRLMLEVVRRLGLDMNYRIQSGLREIELYKQSPVTMQFLDLNENQSLACELIPLSASEVQLAGVFNEQEWQVKCLLNDTIATPAGRVLVTPTFFYAENYFGTSITVVKRNQNNTALALSNGVLPSLPTNIGTIINLRLNDVSPARAEDILNTLIDVYNEDGINEKNRVAKNTSDFINERLMVIEEELGNVDTDIEQYKRNNRLTDIRSESGMYLQNTSRYQQQGLDLENQLALAKYILVYLGDPANSSDLIPSNTGISDVNIESQISEYNDLLLKRDKLISNSSNKNPVVTDMNNSLAAMRQNVVRAVENLVNGLNMRITNIRQQEAQTSRRISAVPTQQKYVLTVERQQKIKEELYLYLLNKREENELSMNISENYARIIDPAYGSNVPVSPRSNIILLAALFLGFIIPGGGLWLRISMDTKVRSRKEIEEKISVPFLGEVPYCDKEDMNAYGVAVTKEGRDIISEAFRIVRTNIEFMRMRSEDKKVVMFTSFNVEAGKTFVSSNLAVSIAYSWKKVVLLDMDIRKATLSNHGKKETMGISTYLSGETDSIDKIIKRGEFNSPLDVIYSGPIPPNPVDLLLSDRLDKLIIELRKRYDYIFIDNVPSHMLADAMIVNRVADLTVYVIRAGKMDRRLLPEIEKLYQDKKYHNMSVLLNGIQPNSASYGYYHYGYGYGYGYGYDYKYEPKKKRKKKSKLLEYAKLH